jgi:thioredoxin-related protein
MSRPYFESPLCADPMSDEAPKARGGGIPAIRILVIGAVVIGLTLGVAQIQSVVARPEAPAIATDFFDQATQEGKLLALVFTSDYSDKCVRMDHQSWPDEGVQRLITRRFHLVRLDIDDRTYREYVDSYGVETAPTLILATARGSVLVDVEGDTLRHEGYLNAVELRSFLGKAGAAGSTRRTTSSTGRTTP